MASNLTIHFVVFYESRSILPKSIRIGPNFSVRKDMEQHRFDLLQGIFSGLHKLFSTPFAYAKIYVKASIVISIN